MAHVNITALKIRILGKLCVALLLTSTAYASPSDTGKSYHNAVVNNEIFNVQSSSPASRFSSRGINLGAVKKITLTVINSHEEKTPLITAACNIFDNANKCIRKFKGKTLALSNGAKIKLSRLNSGCVLYPNDPICGFSYIGQTIPVTVYYSAPGEFRGLVDLKITINNRYCAMNPKNHLCIKSLDDKLKSLGIKGKAATKEMIDLFAEFSFSPASVCHNGITAKNVKCKSKF